MFVLQVSGPKRVLVTQSGQKPVSTRVLSTAPGPQRVPRPVNQQKPLGLPGSVKTTSPGDQNINTDQLRTAAQAKQQPKSPTKSSEPSKPDKRKRDSCGCLITLRHVEHIMIYLCFSPETTPSSGSSDSAK